MAKESFLQHKTAHVLIFYIENPVHLTGHHFLSLCTRKKPSCTLHPEAWRLQADWFPPHLCSVCALCLERPAPISPLLTWIFLLHSPKLYSDITSSSESFLSLLTLESRLWTLNTQCLSLTVLYWLWLSICELLEGKACILSLNRWHTAATCKMFILSKIL